MEKCRCIKNVRVSQNGKALIEPDYQFFSHPHYKKIPLEGCFCPRSSQELKKCLQGCLNEVLNDFGYTLSQIESVYIIDENGKELELELKIVKQEK